MAEPISATVRHLTKNHVTIAPERGYSVTLFNLVGGNVEAIVSANDGSETIRLLVVGPGPAQTLSITTDASGVVNFVYAETEEELR